MKTKEIAEKLRICYKGKCDKCTMVMKSDCIDDLLRVAAEKLWKNEVEINNQRCEIEALKKDLAEREAASSWISVEDIPVPPEKYFVFTVLPKIIIKRNPETGEPAYWMPLPDPPDPPKKVKTYKDVFFEAFPNAPLAKEIDGIPAACRSLIFGKSNKCSMDPNCEDCWNQPYPEEEGGAE